MSKDICGYCGCEIDDDHARGCLMHSDFDALRLADEFERSSGAWGKRDLADWGEESAATIHRQHAELTRLRAELAEARKDAERINAAEQRKFCIEPPLREPSAMWVISQEPFGLIASGGTLRETLDSAIAKEKS